MAEPPIFWTRYLADLRAEHADAATDAENYRSALEISNVGVEPLVDLIHRLATELEARERIPDPHGPWCSTCTGRSFSQPHDADCPLARALRDAEAYGWVPSSE